MVAPLKRVSADALADGANAKTLFDTNGGAGTVVARTANSVTGSGRGFEANGAATQSAFGNLLYSAGLSTAGAQIVIEVGTAPPNALDFILMKDSSVGQASILNARLSTSNVLTVADAGGTTRYTANSGGALAAGKYWLTVAATIGTTTSNGHIYAYLRKASDDSVVSMGTDPGPVCNTGTVSPGLARFGKTGTVGAYSANFDKPGITEGSTAEIDRITSGGTAPTADAGPDFGGVEPWDIVTITGAGTAVGTTIASYAWAQTAGATVTLIPIPATPAATSFQAPGVVGGTTVTLQLTVTDGNGLTGTDTIVVTMLAPNERTVIGGTAAPIRIRSAH